MEEEWLSDDDMGEPLHTSSPNPKVCIYVHMHVLLTGAGKHFTFTYQIPPPRRQTTHPATHPAPHPAPMASSSVRVHIHMMFCALVQVISIS